MPETFDNPNATGRLKASYALTAPLGPARADVPLFASVRVQNDGSVVWPDRGTYPVHLSYHWLDENDQILEWDGIRADLPAPLAPGEAATVLLRIEPPPHAGPLKLQIDLVEEGVGWFSMQGVWPLIERVQVAPAPAFRGRAAVIGPLCLPNDAIGNVMIDQLRMLQARGYETAILVEYLDMRHPRELLQHMLELKLSEVKSGHITPLTRRPLSFLHNADVLIYNYPLPYQLFDTITMVDSGVLIFDYHGVTPPELWDGEGREHYITTVRRQMQLVRYADYAIAHSSFTRGELLATGAVAAERVFQMAYSVPLDRFTPGPKPAYLLERYGLRADQPVLLYVGRMASNKRFTDVIRALPAIRASVPETHLLLVGDNRPPVYAPLVAQALELAQELGVADAVTFTGMVPDAELPDHYRLCDIFTTASHHEGFCIPVIEAMACGKPVVGAHATALPETIGEGGVTFTPGDVDDLVAKVLALLAHRAPVEAA